MSNLRPSSMVIAFALLGLVQFGPVAPAVATPVPISSPQVAVASPVVFAESVSWYGFVRYWRGFVNRADRVVLVAGLVAAAALFIITRGKWLK